MIQSWLIISKNRESSATYVTDQCRQLQIAPLDITRVEHTPSIGIQDIRELQKTLSLKPFQGQKKAALIFHAETITTDAQNAFLKTLEEPPADTYLFLIASSEEALLPTIRSRCSLVHLTSSILPETTSSIPLLSQLSIQEKLFLAQEKGKHKDEALMWLETCIMFFRDQMVAPTTSREDQLNSLCLLRSLHHTFSIIQTTNVSPRLALEHCFLTT